MYGRKALDTKQQNGAPAGMYLESCEGQGKTYFVAVFPCCAFRVLPAQKMPEPSSFSTSENVYDPNGAQELGKRQHVEDLSAVCV